MRFFVRATVAAAGLGLLCSGCAAPAPLRVMSFHLDRDGHEAVPHGWPAFRGQIADAASAQQPDVLALQGVQADQVRELQALLKEYDYVATGSADGEQGGDCVPVFFRRDRFLRVDAGHFWLSPKPKEVGSVGWDASEPAVVTWVELRLKESPLKTVRVLNTCFDARGQQARLESAKLVRRLVESYGGRPLVLTGMFHCRSGSEPYRILTEDRRNRMELRDANAAGGMYGKPSLAVKVRRGNSSRRCEWILFNRGFEVELVAPAKTPSKCSRPGGPTPVEATLRLAAAASRGYS